MNSTKLKLRIIAIVITVIVVYSLLLSVSDFEKFSHVWILIKLEYIPPGKPVSFINILICTL